MDVSSKKRLATYIEAIALADSGVEQGFSGFKNGEIHNHHTIAARSGDEVKIVDAGLAQLRRFIEHKTLPLAHNFLQESSRNRSYRNGLAAHGCLITSIGNRQTKFINTRRRPVDFHAIHCTYFYAIERPTEFGCAF